MMKFEYPRRGVMGCVVAGANGLWTLLIFSFLCSCSPKKKVCEFTSDNEELVIYNNILTDLITAE